MAKVQRFEYVCKIDQSGRAVGSDAESIRGDLRKHFPGQYVKIIVLGYENPYSDEARGYYHSVVVPALINGLIEAGHEIDKRDREQVREARKEIEGMLIKAAKEIDMIVELSGGEEVSYWPEMKDLNAKQYGMIIEDMIEFIKTFLGVQEVPKPVKKK